MSACLLGVPCRYDGAGKPCAAAVELLKHHQVIPVCPEQLGGLCTPRLPAEIVGEEVMRKDGIPVTEAYQRGAEETAKLCRLFGCDAAVLKSRSPSCGSFTIYDGTFSGQLIPGQGVTAKKITELGIPVTDEEHLERISSIV